MATLASFTATGTNTTVPETVINAIRAVGAAGWDDMYDRECVLMLAASLGYEDEAVWLAENRHLYFIGLRRTGIRGSDS